MAVETTGQAALHIRALREDDCVVISEAFAAQGWQKPTTQYRRYCQECEAGKRTALVAEATGVFAGYITILWQSDYPDFQAQNIPEIADFNVSNDSSGRVLVRN